MNYPHIKSGDYLGKKITSFWSETTSYIETTVTLTLSMVYLNIKVQQGHLQSMANFPTKMCEPCSKLSLVIDDRNQFLNEGSCGLDHL